MKLTEYLTSIADVIRERLEIADIINAMDFPDKINEVYDQGHFIGYLSGRDSMVDPDKIIEKTKIGNPVVITDVSELPHTVSVKLSKINLFDKNNIDFYKAYIRTVDSTWSCATDTSSSVRVKCKANTSYTISLSSQVPVLRVASVESDNTPSASLVSVGVENFKSLSNASETTFTTSENAKYIVIQISGSHYNSVIDSLQILTDKPISNVEVLLNEDGHLYTTNNNGEFECESLSPNMTFSTDTDFDIEVNYWKSYGVQLQYDRFWDNYQLPKNQGGNYNYAFAYWNEKCFYPKYDLLPKTISTMFFGFNNGNEPLDLISRLNECGIVFDSSSMMGVASYTFQNAKVTTIPTLNLANGSNMLSTFENCTAEVIEKLVLQTNLKNQQFHRTFYGCSNLREIRIENHFGQSVSFSDSPLLSVESLRSILTALTKDAAYANGKTLTLNSASQAIVETDSECITQLTSAITAGWTIAYA